MTERVIDLRSDTVTLPPPGMRAAMAAAELGDDVWREDPTVSALEERAADLLGKEAALFVPSGTMGNLIAAMTHMRPGEEMIAGADMHTVAAEAGGPARLAGVSTRTVAQRRAEMNPADVVAAIRPDDAHFPRTTLLLVEQPKGGWVMPLANLEALAAAAHTHRLIVHMDAARIFNASIATGVPAAQFASHADSAMFCISKGLSAPVGSLLTGRHDFIREARRTRKVLGGGMRQAGVIAAAGLYALDHMIDRLAEDHENARQLAAGLRDRGWILDRDRPETNIFFADPPPDVALDGLAHDMARQGVLIYSPSRSRTIRFVTHYGVEARDITRALEVIDAVTGTKHVTR